MRLDFSNFPKSLLLPQDIGLLLPLGGDITRKATSDTWIVEFSSGVENLFNGAIIEFKGYEFKYNSTNWLIDGSRMDSISVRINDMTVVDISEINMGSEFFQLPYMDIMQAYNLIFSRDIHLEGTNFDDVILVGAGNDHIDGGAGQDIAVFAGMYHDYEIRVDNSIVTVIDLRSGDSNQGMNVLNNIQILKFSDKSIEINLIKEIELPEVVEGGVYRFFNEATGVHFMTTSSDERDMIINSMPTFRYEGVAFTTSAEPDDGLAVFRFFNAETGAHFYTASEAERDTILSQLPAFSFEGVAFHAFEDAAADRQAVYRFYNTETGTHFYTASDNERDDVMSGLPSFTFEGVAYYVDFA